MTPDAPGSADLPELPPTSWAVLGMLSYGEEVSGYDIKKWADWSIRHYYWSPSFSQVYSELKRLEKHGFATSRMSDDGGRTRRMYRITDEGVAAIARWEADAPVEQPMLKHGVLLRVAFGHVGEPDRLKQILREHAHRMGELQHQVSLDEKAAESEPGWSYARLAMRWAERYYASERALAYELIDEIDDVDRVLKDARRPEESFPHPRPGHWREVEKQRQGVEPEGGARPDRSAGRVRRGGVD
ncbi:putative PadR-like transcriptional regulator [Gordonia polyisoprenivorans VH2]|uniref:Putative PadR-like transcriptional regulator n=1 Tax=Gordonia polyisoprenivorans (strain DSM 44266 / VH2) TaxID=1112204 RepID=H6MT11_GORPV|nr:PadR family transcriptional regulator [Gordonia polyisoprenivorans]AFA75132.1 putative PadR-like transcriptional regulator [Gordonia polyisoprenivorans VH2]OZC32077.1 PadR family transcriptional regulator [Gordonia polyisoprenivorans]HCS56773.1 PadR family transcriptional regulator [Gordonia polyisoprenivorans]